MNMDEHYEIRLKGILGTGWEYCFEGWTLRQIEENHETVLTGPIVDQSVLNEILARITGLNMKLVSLQRVKVDGSREVI